MTKNIPEQVIYILNMLNNNGYDAYIVGGAVRDFVMHKVPHDWDITTNAKPAQVKELFNKTVDTGIKHGTVTVMLNGEGFEITTYRCDGLYSDGRHPDNIEFVDHVEDDLARRDFTINAIAMDVHENIVDPFGGMQDIERGVIRCVGDPNIRFAEDALRMIRAVRFEAKFGFELEPSTKAAIVQNVEKLHKVSVERICDEFTKMLVADHPKQGFIDAYETGITAQIFPEFDSIMVCEQNSPYHYASVGVHTLDTIENINPTAVLRWAMLFHDMGKPAVKEQHHGHDTFYNHQKISKQIADTIMDRFHFSNKDRQEICNLVEYHDLRMSNNTKIRTFAAMFGLDFLNELEQVQLADAKAHAANYVDELVQQSQSFISKAKGFIADGTAIKLNQLQINGNELQMYGFKGKAIGEFLQAAYKECLGQPSLNTNEKLRQRAERIMARNKMVAI